MITNLILVFVFVVGFGSLSRPVLASAPEQTPPGVISSAQDGISTAAGRPWTTAEMLAAIPYPMTTDIQSAPSAVDPLGSATGAAGLVTGSAPGKAAAPAFEGYDFNSTPGLTGYAYPAPFTRLSVKTFTVDTWYPYSTVGKLFFTQLGVNYVCSGSVIALKGIVTAGHCVHAGNGLRTGWSYNMVFVPSYKSGVAPYGQWTLSTLMVYTTWYYGGTTNGWGMDYGIGRVNLNALGQSIGSRVGYLGFAWNSSRIQSWWSFGYPAAAPFSGAFMTLCTSSWAYDETYGGAAVPPLMSIGCDQTGGTSGGPWIRNFGGGNYVNGVNESRHTDMPLELNGPYFDTNAGNLLNTARTW
jgi:V8-like Glu-specific endopeptidase